MSLVMPKLAPFWYEPEFQPEGEEKISFLLKPLTQADMIEVDEHENPNRARYVAGRMAIMRIRGLADDDGNEVRWAEVADRFERSLVVQAGFRAICAAGQIDWAFVVKLAEDKMREVMGDAGVTELPERTEPLVADHEDPEKN